MGLCRWVPRDSPCPKFRVLGHFLQGPGSREPFPEASTAAADWTAGQLAATALTASFCCWPITSPALAIAGDLHPQHPSTDDTKTFSLYAFCSAFYPPKQREKKKVSRFGTLYINSTLQLLRQKFFSQAALISVTPYVSEFPLSLGLWSTGGANPELGHIELYTNAEHSQQLLIPLVGFFSLFRFCVCDWDSLSGSPTG